jgi:hypothetical protein
MTAPTIPADSRDHAIPIVNPLQFKAMHHALKSEAQ